MSTGSGPLGQYVAVTSARPAIPPSTPRVEAAPDVRLQVPEADGAATMPSFEQVYEETFDLVWRTELPKVAQLRGGGSGVSCHVDSVGSFQRRTGESHGATSPPDPEKYSSKSRSSWSA